MRELVGLRRWAQTARCPDSFAPCRESVQSSNVLGFAPFGSVFILACLSHVSCGFARSSCNVLECGGVLARDADDDYDLTAMTAMMVMMMTVLMLATTVNPLG